LQAVGLASLASRTKSTLKGVTQPRTEYDAFGEHDAQGDGPCVAIVGGTTRKVFEAYVKQLLSPGLESGQVVVIDNLPTHSGERLIEVRGCELLYLRRPYSPDRRGLLEDQGPIAAGRNPREVLGGTGRDPVGGQSSRCPGLLRALRLPSSGALIVNSLRHQTPFRAARACEPEPHLSSTRALRA
jgi:hypothetical protein